MEATLVDRLRKISALRRQFIEWLQVVVPRVTSYLEHNVVFHGVCIMTTVISLAALYGTTKSMNLFSFHPLFMIFACCLFLPEGIVAYKNHFLLDSLSPIMQHTKRAKVRSIHQTMQLLGVGFVFLGLLFIIADKIELHLSILPTSFHSFTATILIVSLVIQAVVGQEKLTFHQLNQTNRRIRRWHGDLGLLLWDAICFTLLSGLVSLVSFSWYTVAVFIAPFILWLTVLLQMMGKNAIKDEELDGETTGDITATNTQHRHVGGSGHNSNKFISEDGEEFEEQEEDEDDFLLSSEMKRRHSRSNLAYNYNPAQGAMTPERSGGSSGIGGDKNSNNNINNNNNNINNNDGDYDNLSF